MENCILVVSVFHNQLKKTKYYFLNTPPEESGFSIMARDSDDQKILWAFSPWLCILLEISIWLSQNEFCDENQVARNLEGISFHIKTGTRTVKTWFYKCSRRPSCKTSLY